MSNIIKIETVENKLVEVDGKPVLLASDVAELYGVEVKRLNENVKKNLELFPEEFMFQLTKEQWDNLKSSETTSSSKQHGGTRYNPYVFTEQGLYMVATILRSDRAKQVHFHIVETFAKLRQVSRNLHQVIHTSDANTQKELISQANQNLQDVIETEIVEHEELDDKVEKITDEYTVNLGFLKFKRTIENKK